MDFLVLIENEQLWATNIYSHLNDRESKQDNAYTEKRYIEIVRASTFIKCGLKSLHKSSKAVNKFLWVRCGLFLEYSWPSLFAVLVFTDLIICQKTRKQRIISEQHTFRPKLSGLVYVGSKYLRILTPANSKGILYVVRRQVIRNYGTCQ